MLKCLLVSKGHKVWMRGTWNDPVSFARLLDIDVLVGGQIAESATHFVGKFAKENKIRFVLNTTEPLGMPKNFEMFVTYNTTELNDEIIDLQTIAARDIYKFIMEHAGVKHQNKIKYKFLGFPRLDLTTNMSLRNLESPGFKKRNNLEGKRRVFLFISSLLMDSAFEGVPQKDLDRWNYSEIKKRTKDILLLTQEVLTRLITEILDDDDILLIKKHPWDCSNFFKETFESKKCKVLGSSEYILPCIVNSDFVLHTFSTSAVEAWILGKKTISILPSEYKESAFYNHMLNELTVSSFDELRTLVEEYPSENPSIKSLEIFSPNLDGKATVRLAEEISKLKPYVRLPNKTRVVAGNDLLSNLKNLYMVSRRKLASTKLKLRVEIREWMIDQGWLKYKVLNHAQPNTKNFDFYTWENERARVIKIYKKAFKKYAKDYSQGRLQ